MGVSYAANDWDKMWLWDGITSAAQDAGIDACPQDWNPTPSTASGLIEPGTHRFRYRYTNSRTGFVSNPSNEVSITVVAGAQQLTFAVASSGTANIVHSADSKVDEIIVEMTLVDGSAWYTAGTVSNSGSSIVLSLSDASLSGAPILYRDFGHDVPPYFRHVASHRGRMWGLGHIIHNTGTIQLTNGGTGVTGTSTEWSAAVVGRYLNPSDTGRTAKIGGYSSATSISLDSAWGGSSGSGIAYAIQPEKLNVLYCSQANRPESWAPLSFSEVLLDRTDQATALVPFFNELVICGYYTMERLTFTNEPFEAVGGRLPDAQISLISSNRGSLNPNCVIEVEGVVYGMDFTGCWAWDGGRPAHISEPVDAYLRPMLLKNQDLLPHVCWSPKERAVRWTLGLSGQYFVDFYPDTRQWTTGIHHVQMGSSCQAFDLGGQFAAYGGQNGYVWKADTSPVEGFPQLDGNGTIVTTVGTVAASPSPTATVFTVSEGGLYVTNISGQTNATLDQMKGAPCYSVGLNETRIIASNTATVVTLISPGFSQAPAAGDTLYFGRVPASLYTRNFILRDSIDKNWPRYLHIWFIPAKNEFSASYPIVANSDITVSLYEGIGPKYDLDGPKTDWTTRSEEGISFTSGQAKITLDLGDDTGYKKIPIGSFQSRYLQAAISTSKPPTSGYLGPRILKIAIDGYATEVPVDVV
tara:strand:- start:6140 stop:8224 length:2085 start_codon:yes stop_codon:yes gene_type:complete